MKPGESRAFSYETQLKRNRLPVPSRRLPAGIEAARSFFLAAIIRAALGYFLLVFMVRIVGRRPGKQMNPFEFVLIFFFGRLELTFVVADDR